MISPAPTGTVTFLFTDIEGSTRLRQAQPQAYERSLAQHNALLRQAIEAHGGHVFKIIGDAFCAAFATAPSAAGAALEAQQALQASEWGEAALRVRMALHSGAADYHDGDYWGFTLARAARLLPAGHGGQVLLSQAATELVQDELPDGASLRDLGEQRLRDLVRPEHIYQLVAPGLPESFPPLRTLDAQPHNLPVQLTSFVGREKEMADVKRLLRATRLLTLVGPGGTGKSRLALQAAAEVTDDYPDGTWLVELAPLAEPDLLPEAVAAVFGLREEGGRTALQVLLAFLRSKAALLIVDNCEHIVEACARLADQILRAAPRLSLLASSREALGIAGETSYHVPSLSLPSERGGHWPEAAALTQYEAVRLFIDRASSVHTGFTVTNLNAPAVAEICHRLDGIPLAIELAAARLRALRVEELLARLDDCFRLLTGGSRMALPRHQTLRALIDWSHGLLTEPERIVFRRLPAFAGGWTLTAAEQVCSGDGIDAWQIIDLVDSLVNKSLAIVDESQPGPRTRFRMLETIRQYARDRLFEAGESEAVRRRHLGYFVRLAEQAEPRLRRAEQLDWLAHLDAEQDNLRAALEWALATEPEAALRLGAALGGHWHLRGQFSEGQTWLERALAADTQATPSLPRARAMLSLGSLVFDQRGAVEAAPFFEKARGLSHAVDDAWGQAWALFSLSGREMEHNPAEAVRLLQEALQEFQALNDPWGEAWCSQGLAWLAFTVGDRSKARTIAEQILVAARQLGDRSLLNWVLITLSMVARFDGDYDRALLAAEEGLMVSRELGSRSDETRALWEQAVVAYRRAEYGRATSLLQEALRLSQGTGDLGFVPSVLMILGSVAAHRGEHERARAWHAEALAISDRLGFSGYRAQVLEAAGRAARLRGEAAQAAAYLAESAKLSRELGEKFMLGRALVGLGQVTCEQGQYARAAAMLEEALAECEAFGDMQALAEVQQALGCLAAARGDLAGARKHLREALRRHRRLGTRLGIAGTLEALAGHAGQLEDWERAARLLGAAEALREQIGAPVPPVDRAAYEHAVALAREQLGEEGFTAAWAEGRALSWEQAAAVAMEG